MQFPRINKLTGLYQQQASAYSYCRVWEEATAGTLPGGAHRKAVISAI